MTTEPNPGIPNPEPQGGLYDVAIVGGGPVGLAAAIACKRSGLSYVVLEKGCVVNAIFDYPTDMTFFTTAPELEIGGHPFVSPFDKPKRVDALQYYRKVTQAEGLNVRQYTRVEKVHAAPAGFTLQVEAQDGRQDVVEARRVVVATGYYDSPVPLDIPGEDSENVSHYYTEAHPFFGLNVTIIGAGNSAADAALDLMNAGANVTMVVRGEGIRSTVKYWVKPNLENRIKEGRIGAHFRSQVVEILPDAVRVQREDGTTFLLPTHFTFAMTGYLPNLDFLEGLDLRTLPDECLVLSEHHESTVPGLFVAGSAGYAGRTNQVFIENGRIHAEEAVAEIARQLAQAEAQATARSGEMA
ncbi:FAD-dependent pyridine nucleotide-disulfide oxidoreductase [Deinococcus proteolyticus MRP]|uniref:FAD-dependent pyridine nucleotide-disulfide oxidoreductase n=1 Tax=Deinococcus proteolyticus (strain ATCC 35074 / DSM 20540 / JCM 6276 / NBRC 101906 / NCIMB 13154 / VKM Ac-1939 / CCM 2703 / MRP) TaxID=693977 RepID=F0RL73_DEIPM|nr:YpdA family putative bacillithiol disulfide reductase [Deinococcus proteolyticus]ADY26865.1 FAD-dependent pyridine nucleotide-disulfide oxidoreductase [Deinococcus proteolyticus MRP]